MKLQTLALGTAILFGFSSYSLAYTINGGDTNVGFLDRFIVGADLSKSGEDFETDWVNEKLGTIDTYTLSAKTETVGVTTVDDGSGDPATDNSAFGAFSLEKSPAYFLVKKGSGKNSEDGNSHWLFENKELMNWGVVDFAALFGDDWNKKNNFTVSHVTEFDGDVPVPEPGTLVLMLTGFAGLLAARRRTRKLV